MSGQAPPCTCGHPQVLHELVRKPGRVAREECSTGTPAGRCPCDRYTPDERRQP